MVDKPLVRARLVAQGMCPVPGGCRSSFETPEAVAAGLGALQGQDLPGALSSVALRVMHAGSGVEASVALERTREAFARGRLVRGYPMRGTVFVTSAEDLWWMTDLCAGPAVKQARKNSPRLGIDDEHFSVARDVLERSCAGREGATRAQIFEAWAAAGVPTEGGCSYHLLKHFLSTMFVTYGPLTEDGPVENRVVVSREWLPESSQLAVAFNDDRQAATAELLRRYVLSRGPVTLRDFQWWTKLPLTLIRAAARDIESSVEEWGTDESGEALLCAPDLPEVVAQVGRVTDRPQLLPPFDEMILGYPDRTYIVPAEHHATLVPGNNGVFRSAVVAGSQVVGYWRRKGQKGKRSLVLEPFGVMSEARENKVRAVFEQYPHANA
ncbi:winged helix DNA-binding domain-containing protein [Brevibacterium paucivorans]